MHLGSSELKMGLCNVSEIT